MAHSDPDGHTLLLTVTSQLSNASGTVKPKYDAVKDFTPIIGISLAPMALAVPVQLGVDSMKQLDELAKKKPLAYGSYGLGSSGQVMLGTYDQRLGANMVHVPYRGEAPMVTDLMSNHVQVALLTVGTARALQQSGKVKLLGTVGPTRSEILPKLPTLGDLGYPGFDWTFGVALYASSKTPEPILDKLRKVSQTLMASPDMQAKLRAQSAQPWGASAEELTKRLVIDTVLWEKTLTKLGETK